jgi:hypothetical protein
MSLKKTIAVLTVSVLALAAVLGVAAYRSASAQTSTPQAPSAAAPPAKGFDHPGPGRGFGGGYSSEDLANALGITVEEVNAAYQQANEAALKQAVEAGLITQAQADEMLARGGFPHAGRWLGQSDIDYDALLADALGISVETLQVAYAQAADSRIDQAVADGYLTQEQADLMKGQRALYASESFQSAMQSAFEAAVSQAVSEGLITQAQADLILENANGMGLRGFGEFHGPGGPGGPGRHGEWGGGPPPDQTLPEAPATEPSSGL